MHLPGRLSASTLGDLLGTLHRQGTTGLLELREMRGPRGDGVPGRLHRVHLRGGLGAGVDTPLAVPMLGEILEREGLASEAAIRRLVGRIQSGDRRAAGEILLRDGLAPGDAIRRGIDRQLRLRIEALFALEDAAVSFHVARPLPAALRAQPIGPEVFLRGRPRARDQRKAGPPPPPPAPAADLPRTPARPLADDPRSRAMRLLGLGPGAEVGEIRRAFRKLASALHPDRLGAAAAAEQRALAEKFAELSAAYHLLVA